MQKQGTSRQRTYLVLFADIRHFVAKQKQVGPHPLCQLPELFDGVGSFRGCDLVRRANDVLNQLRPVLLEGCIVEVFDHWWDVSVLVAPVALPVR